LLRMETLSENLYRRKVSTLMAVTIHDVAREAGVGIGTVSRVVNNRPYVRPATRERVLAAINKLQYKPDPIARSMILKRTGSVGVVVPFFTRFFFMEVLKGVDAALTRLEYELVLYNISNKAQQDRYFAELPMLRRVDGLLALSITPDEGDARRFHEIGLPVVLIDAYSPLLTSVVINNVEGAYRAVMYLIEKGHRRIGFINGIIEGNFNRPFNPANDRLIGLHRALGEAGLCFEPELVLEAEWSRQGGRQAALQLLSLSDRPSAIFAASDIQAIGVLEAAKALDIAVPDELSVIGFDGIEMADFLDLTTMVQPMYQIGELGVNKLMEKIEHPDGPPELLRLDTRLREGHTVKKMS
jgi:DNA-binding LacI/PurR family transcriptional regulator